MFWLVKPSSFPKLNLPPCSFLYQEKSGKTYIFDSLRKKWLVLTPEEWVRQHVVQFLLNNQFSKNLMQLESEHRFQERKKRTDILVFDKQGEPFLVVECKAAHIPIDATTFSQVAVYNYCIEAPFVMVTNGLQVGIFKRNIEKNSYTPISYLPKPS